MPTLPHAFGVDFFMPRSPRSGQVALTVFGRQVAGNDNGARRYTRAIVNFTCFAIVDFGALPRYTPSTGNDGTFFDNDAFHDFQNARQ